MSLNWARLSGGAFSGAGRIGGMDILLAESIVVQAIARFARGEPGAWIGLTAVIALIVFSAYRTWVRNVQDD